MGLNPATNMKDQYRKSERYDHSYKGSQENKCGYFENNIELVYFDAFAPEKQPEMWDEKIFREIFNHLSPGGILSTYCAKGEIRRRLQSVGFTVERLPGPPNGKREILRASKR